MKRLIILLYIVISLLFCAYVYASQRNTFIFSQIQYRANIWNPYPNAWDEIYTLINRIVNMPCQEKPRILSLSDPLLFSSPFICLVGEKKLPSFTEGEKIALKRYLEAGGILFINDTSLTRNSEFAQSIRSFLKEILPKKTLEMVPYDHAVYKSFYLVKIVGGRRIVKPYLEGIFLNGRLAVIYTSNDLLGAYAKDTVGNFLYNCIPGGYEQRKESFKLMLNIIIFSVTGTYKEDVIHKPYIEEKTSELLK